MTDYIDLGEIILTPIEPNLMNDNIIPIETVFDGIRKVINELTEDNIIKEDEDTFLNIIAHEETSIYLLSDFLKSLPPNVKYSVSIMLHYKIINLSGSLNYRAPMIVLHNGIDLNVNNMMLHIFSTMSYRFTKPTYVTLFENEYSQYPILNTWANSYTGYGKSDENNTNDYWNIKYE